MLARPEQWVERSGDEFGEYLLVSERAGIPVELLLGAYAATRAVLLKRAGILQCPLELPLNSESTPQRTGWFGPTDG